VTGPTASIRHSDSHGGQGRGPTPYRLPDPAVEAALAARMRVRFDNPLVLRQALTHRSVLHDWQQVEDISAILQSNERLEFLGDAVLGAIAAEYLYNHEPSADEGQLTRRRVAAVRAETLVHWARELAVDEALYLGTGEQVSHNVRDRMLAGAFEALVGAVHVDQGREAAERFVQGFLERDLDAILQQEAVANPKGHLQEVLQERERVGPEYETIATAGPDHAREFTVVVKMREELLGEGHGRSKREAQQMAAREALANLGVIDRGAEPGGRAASAVVEGKEGT
jgi:ribonuclease III